MRIDSRWGRMVLCAALLAVLNHADAQSSLPIYTDHLVNGFQDWSWSCTRNWTNPTPVHSGTGSVSVTASLGGAISLHQSGINTSIYTNFTFWANGGASGGQVLQVYVTLGNSDQSATTLAALTTDWQQFTLPLTTLKAANKTNLTRINIRLNSGSTGTFYLDDLQFSPMPVSPLVHVGLDAGQTLRMADPRWFGVNTATWDGLLGNSQSLSLLKEIGCQALRWPGGSTSDTYHWASDLSANSTFLKLATNLGAKVFVTANYGSGTTNEAAAWVKYFNVTNHCGFQYWEIGNENYGTWEYDTHAVPNDPYTYANLVKSFSLLMKQADTNIHIGVVMVPGEGSYSNNANHFAVNPRTGTINYGWTPVMLSTLKTNGAVPDFVIYHFYPQWTAPVNAGGWQPNVPVSDPLLLQVAANWAQDAADIRQQLTDYLGAAATNIEMVVTENNCDSGAMGRQSTSIVNGLYLADSACQLMKTEFNAYLWWDFHNGPDTDGVFDPTLYGWRSYGDYGLLNSSNARHPTFYAEKLLQSFVRPGDTILTATSDDILLSAYAARKADGALALLVINKAPTNAFNAQISLTNFAPWSTAAVRSYGLAQDEAARTNAAVSAQDILTNSAPAAAVFTNTFPPYSLTLFTLAPAPPQLQAIASAGGNFVFQLLGQTNVPYVIQSATNLAAPVWISESTNRLAGSVLTLTNSSPAATKFWRAVWLP